jgi:hypothetical protein
MVSHNLYKIVLTFCGHRWQRGREIHKDSKIRGEMLKEEDQLKFKAQVGGASS